MADLHRSPRGDGRATARGNVVATVAVGLAVVAGVVLRFWVRSPMWLDEALSVNIASLPLSEIPDALRHDGHPPLYYVLLHGWMRVFGSSNVAVRAMSGFWSLALLPLVWLAARRLAGPRAAGFALVAVALSPFAVRYATEARMYSMLSVLAVTFWLAADSARRVPSARNLAAVSAATSLLLWTHYWSMWFLGAAGLLILVGIGRARRDAARERTRALTRLAAAMVVGGVAFLPWLTTLLYQSSHTGTPWAQPMRPAEILAMLAPDLGGAAPHGEAVLLGWLLVFGATLAVWIRVPAPWVVSLELRRPNPSWLMGALVVSTLALGCLAGFLAGSAFASRYAAVVVPFVVVLAAGALAALRPRGLGVAGLVVVALLGLVGMGRNVVAVRSDAGHSSDAIVAAAEPGDLVVYCPDQAGPGTSRMLESSPEMKLEQVTFPSFASPELVDWVDYRDRVESTSVQEFGNEVLQRAEGRSVFLVYSTGYYSHREICPALFNVLGRQRPPEVLTEATDAFESAGVARFPPPP